MNQKLHFRTNKSIGHLILKNQSRSRWRHFFHEFKFVVPSNTTLYRAYSHRHAVCVCMCVSVYVCGHNQRSSSSRSRRWSLLYLLLQRPSATAASIISRWLLARLAFPCDVCCCALISLLHGSSARGGLARVPGGRAHAPLAPAHRRLRFYVWRLSSFPSLPSHHRLCKTQQAYL